MDTLEKFTKIFNKDGILKINKNSKLTKEKLIFAFTKNIDENIPLYVSLGYSDKTASRRGLARGINIIKNNSKKWPQFLLNLYYPKVKINKKQNISVSPKYDRAEYDRQYALLNKDKKLANSKKRRLSKINRTPSWLSNEDFWFIEEIYSLARLRTELTGKQWHVDHIIPLQGKLVSGLHIPSNLQVILAKENISKSNKYNPIV